MDTGLPIKAFGETIKIFLSPQHFSLQILQAQLLILDTNIAIEGLGFIDPVIDDI